MENAQDHDMGMDQELSRFRGIIGHQGPLLASDPDWKGCKYNVQVEWETGEITFEPLSIIAADDPVTCAAYAKQNDLLALEGWHRFRSLAKKDKVLARAIKQSKIRQVRRSQTYMFEWMLIMRKENDERYLYSRTNLGTTNKFGRPIHHSNN